jgi:hypothetical protein
MAKRQPTVSAHTGTCGTLAIVSAKPSASCSVSVESPWRTASCDRTDSPSRRTSPSCTSAMAGGGSLRSTQSAPTGSTPGVGSAAVPLAGLRLVVRGRRLLWRSRRQVGRRSLARGCADARRAPTRTRPARPHRPRAPDPQAPARRHIQNRGMRLRRVHIEPDQSPHISARGAGRSTAQAGPNRRHPDQPAHRAETAERELRARCSKPAPARPGSGRLRRCPAAVRNCGR